MVKLIGVYDNTAITSPAPPPHPLLSLSEKASGSNWHLISMKLVVNKFNFLTP